MSQRLTQMTDRTFGVEIEIANFDTSHNGSDGMLSRIRAEGWTVKRDGSIRGERPYEVVSPVLQGQAGKASLKRVTDILNEHNTMVNKTCGLHVHIGVGDWNWRNLRKLTAMCHRYEDIIYAMLPASRETESFYSKRMRFASSDIDGVKSMRDFQQMAQNRRSDGSWTDSARYYGLNLTSYWQHGTVEFRYHSATTSFEKIWNWILLVGGLVKGCEVYRTVKADTKHADRTFAGLWKDMMWKMGFEGPAVISDEMKTMRAYVIRRIEKFNPEKAEGLS